MPFVRLETTEQLAPAKKAELSAKLSRLCAECLSKPEQYVMVSLRDGVSMLFAGSAGPTAFVEIRALGPISPKATSSASEAVCKLLSEFLGIAGGRVFLNFTEVTGSHWGHNGSTLG